MSGEYDQPLAANLLSFQADFNGISTAIVHYL